MPVSIYLSINTLNVNRLNAPFKRHKVVEWVKIQNPSICCYESHFKSKDTETKSEGMKVSPKQTEMKGNLGY